MNHGCIILPMAETHIDEVHAIEQRSFSQPWCRDDILYETTRNHSYYFVAIDVQSGKIAGYAGMWHIVNEAHINNIAVDEPFRLRGVGNLLLETLIAKAIEFEMIGLTLEVRIGNRAAQALYFKHGFIVEGYRRNYYQDPTEDAAIMWKYL